MKNFTHLFNSIINFLYKIKLIILSLIIVNLYACGFHLRGQVYNHYLEITNWQLNGNISNELKHNLIKQFKLYKGNLSTDNIVNNINTAQANIEIHENYSESVNTVSNKGQVSEVRIKYIVSIIVRQADKDKVLLNPTNIEQFRDIAMNESAILAKEQEKQKILKDMQYTAASRILEYLQKIPKQDLQ